MITELIKYKRGQTKQILVIDVILSKQISGYFRDKI